MGIPFRGGECSILQDAIYTLDTGARNAGDVADVPLKKANFRVSDVHFSFTSDFLRGLVFMLVGTCPLFDLCSEKVPWYED